MGFGYTPEWNRNTVAMMERPPLRAFALRVRVLPGLTRLRQQLPAITGSITKVEIVWQGITQQLWPAVGVVKIPAGEYFDVYVSYKADNPEGTLKLWQTCATMIATDGSLANYDLTVGPLPLGGKHMEGTMKLDANGQPGPMPSKETTLRFTLFGFPQQTNTLPDISQW